MARLDFVEARVTHADYLADHLREIDRREVLAVSHYDLRGSIAESIIQSDRAFVGLLGGEPIGVYGVVKTSLLMRTGRPWLLATPRILECRKSVWAESLRFVQWMLDEYLHLSNYVSAENRDSIRWLKRLGFAIHEPQAYGKHGEMFCYFEQGGAQNV